MDTVLKCNELCRSRESCVLSSFGRAPDRFNNSRLHCIVHEPGAQESSPPPRHRDYNWKYFEGSDNFDTDAGTYVTSDYQETMTCKLAKEYVSEEELEERAIDFLWRLAVVLGVYYAFMIVIGMCYSCGKEKQKKCKCERKCGNKLCEAGTCKWGESGGMDGVLCGDSSTRSTLTYLLMPDFDGEDKEGSSLFNWVSGLGVFGTAKLIWQLVDIVSDFGLLWTLWTVNNEHWMLISAAALCLTISTAAVVFMTYLDFKLYKRFVGPKKEKPTAEELNGEEKRNPQQRTSSGENGAPDCSCIINGAQKRRTLSVRWGLLVLVPIEDITMIGLAIYSFMHGTPEFWSILSICASVTSLIFMQCCGGWVGEAHHLCQDSTPKTGGASTLELADYENDPSAQYDRDREEQLAE